MWRVRSGVLEQGQGPPRGHRTQVARHAHREFQSQFCHGPFMKAGIKLQFTSLTCVTPSFQLIYLKIAGMLFPTSDFWHPVVTPALVCMSQLLTKVCPCFACRCVRTHSILGVSSSRVRVLLEVGPKESAPASGTEGPVSKSGALGSLSEHSFHNARWLRQVCDPRHHQSS